MGWGDYGWGYGGYGGGHVWWVVIPLAALALAAFAIWLRHRREIARLELLRTYVAQGKEPPAEIAQMLRNGGLSYRRDRDWRRAILLGSLAAAFAAIALLSSGVRPHHGFIIGAVILGALAVGSALAGWLQRGHDGP